VLERRGLEPPAVSTVHAALVRDRLIPILRRRGLPLALYVDNGTPWGAARPRQWTRLTA